MTAQQCVHWLCLLLFLRLKSPLLKPYRIWQAETFQTTWWKHTHRLLGKGGLSKSRSKDLFEVPGFHSHGNALTLSCFVCSAWRTSSGSTNSGMLITFVIDEENNNNAVEDLDLNSLSHWLSYRYGGFSLGARSSQALPAGDEVADAIAHIRKSFSLQTVRLTLLAQIYDVWTSARAHKLGGSCCTMFGIYLR